MLPQTKHLPAAAHLHGKAVKSGEKKATTFLSSVDCFLDLIAIWLHTGFYLWAKLRPRQASGNNYQYNYHTLGHSTQGKNSESRK